jgi:hypothetical protein
VLLCEVEYMRLGAFNCIYFDVSILKKKLKKEEEGDELEKILNELKNEQEDRGDVATVTIQIAGLKELVKAVERLAEALKKCGEQ